MNELPEEMKNAEIVIASEKRFAVRNIPFFMLNCFEGVCLFVFAFALFYYKKAIEQNHPKQTR